MKRLAAAFCVVLVMASAVVAVDAEPAAAHNYETCRESTHWHGNWRVKFHPKRTYTIRRNSETRWLVKVHTHAWLGAFRTHRQDTVCGWVRVAQLDEDNALFTGAVAQGMWERQ